MLKSTFLFTFILCLVSVNPSKCQTSDSLVLKEGFAIKLDRRTDIQVISPNAIEALFETGKWESPSENEVVEIDQKKIGTWKKISAGNDGWFKGDSLVNSYVYFKYNSDKEKFILLEGMGNTMVYVNGTPRSGNPYRYKDTFEDWEPKFDYSLIPIKLIKGTNEFLFDCDRGLLKVKLNFVEQGLIFNKKDLTIPDLIVNEPIETYGAIPILNLTEGSYSNLYVKTWSGDSSPEYYAVEEINPLSIFKTPFYIKLPAQKNTGNINLNIDLVKKESTGEKILASTSIDLKTVNPLDVHRETFISKMDGSVQYYAVNPPDHNIDKPALFLSLHGAGVEAINQAYAYYHKKWGYIVAPTNRRPYGYNWENWGRMDALEVLDISLQKFNIDGDRVYLTGHSMGGHGTWHLAINYPDKFAAFGPSAGWISIWSYRIRPRIDSTGVEKMLLRSSKQSDTYAFTTNLKPNGIYILQGALDDNVPPEQARSMVENLSMFHKDFIYHEQPGVGHWWDNNEKEPGADCVDWPPMFDFFAHHSLPDKKQIKIVDFVTANLAITSKNYWVEVINQDEQQKMSKINFELYPGRRNFVGTTDNIKIFDIDASMLLADETISIEVDSQLISGINIPADKKIYLEKENGNWKVTSEPDKQNKYPYRCGNFREVLNHNVVFVYGTHGNKKENKWAFEKARYDAEMIWYRGNGSIEVTKDDKFDPVKYKDRNVILFGNSETNSAWKSLLKDSPVQVSDGKITVGKKAYKGDDYACLMIRPRKDSEFASVGIVAGTGLEGMEMTDFAQYYHPYISFPDIIIYNSQIRDSDEQGVKFSGYFGNDWSLENGEFIGQ